LLGGIIGDIDTQAYISGYLAEARFGIPQHIRRIGIDKLPPDLRATLDAFGERFGIPI